MDNISLGKNLLKVLDGISIELYNGNNIKSTVLCQDDHLFLFNEDTGDLWEVTQEKSIKVKFNKYTFKEFIEEFCPKIIKLIQRDKLKQSLVEVLCVERSCSDNTLAIWHKGDYLLKSESPNMGWHHTNDIYREKAVTSLSWIFSRDWVIDLPTPEELIIFEKERINKGL